MSRSDKIRDYTIEPEIPSHVTGATGAGFWLVAHGTYGYSSVLAGSDFRQLKRHFDTVEEALAFCKTEGIRKVTVREHSTKLPAGWEPQVSPTPPSWFDPANAGEVWHEDDY